MNIQVWEAKLMEVSKRTTNIEPLLDKALNVLGRLDHLYTEGDIKRKRAIIGSIYPEKLTFDGLQYRTTRINEAVRLIYLLDKGWHKKKTGETKVNFDLSCFVPRTGIEPAHCCQYQILSLTRLPVPPSGPQIRGCKHTHLHPLVQKPSKKSIFADPGQPLAGDACPIKSITNDQDRLITGEEDTRRQQGRPDTGTVQMDTKECSRRKGHCSGIP